MKNLNNPAANGVESDSGPVREQDAREGTDEVESFEVKSQHVKLTQVILSDQTDFHNELIRERVWLLHPSERMPALRGNLFVVEDTRSRTGRILVKKEPLPDERPDSGGSDLNVVSGGSGGFVFSLLRTPGTSGNSWVSLDYQGGRLERTRVLHEWQQCRRPATNSHSLPRFLSNTWGDRSRDSRLCESFIEREIDAGQRLGVDIVQLDDGWQSGVTSNSALAKSRGGVWGGFWEVNPRFWEPHPERFPNGLAPVVERAGQKKMEIGLWFAPDSGNAFANWRRDSECLLDLYRRFGIRHFKIDGVQAGSGLALDNLDRFFKAVLRGSGGEVVFDLDITAGVRPGYFGAMEVGPLFLENRYTDWHNYWPHQTLRNLWMLSHWIDPRRLRMEFLNNTRHAEKYPDDPLSPACYDPATLFAMVMFSNPLGWFEVSCLPSMYFETLYPLVALWKKHRETLFGGTLLPVGCVPDGMSGPTGFVSLDKSGQEGYVLMFRGLHDAPSMTLAIPELHADRYETEILSEKTGGISISSGTLHVDIPDRLGFLWSRFSRV